MQDEPEWCQGFNHLQLLPIPLETLHMCQLMAAQRTSDGAKEKLPQCEEAGYKPVI